MSNVVTVQYTKFQNLDNDGNPTKDDMFGFRIYDDYGVGYENLYTSFDELKEILNADTLLDVIRELKGFEDVDSDSCKAVCFNGDYFYWDKKGNLTDKVEQDQDA